MIRPWNISILDTNWGAVRYGIVVFCVGIVTAIGAFLVAIEFRPADERVQQQQERARQLNASPVLLERTGR